METTEKTAIFGLGIIGNLWASHAETAGVLGASWNRTARPASPRFEADPSRCAASATLWHVCIADPPAVRALLKRLEPSLRPGVLVIQSSTIDPGSSSEFEALVRSRGADYLEAPFTGSKPAAEGRKIVFYLGGNESIRRRAEPYLALLSETRLAIGTAPQAAALKLAMNLQIAIQMRALGEGLALARGAGLPDDVFFEALGRNVAHSGLVRLKEPKLRGADWAPQFSVKHLAKDLRLALGAAGALKLTSTAEVLSRLDGLESSGEGDLDFSVVTRDV